uniref:DUF753 domain-containing protein n=1 Tax=Megaselia scalaris TaxID=36166 RepID=T1GQZ3_MEGSC
MSRVKQVTFLVFIALFVQGLQSTCIECNSDNESACISSPNAVKTTCPYNNCYSYQHPETKYVERGCLSNGIPEVCSNLENCNICSNADLCNKESFKVDCLECNSATNADCKDKPEAITSFCQSETCYFRENIENVVSRGCLSVDTEQSCVEDKDCTSCKDEQHCNIKQDTTPECFSCQGDGCSEIDFATQTRVKCNEGSKCITQLNNQGLVVRGCTQSAQEKCLDENTCKICDGRLCNGEIFPTDRLKCIQCNSTAQGDECSLASEKFSRTCNIYNKEDQCFTYADEKGLLYRGCASDKNQACTEDNCLKCSGDNCNTNGLQVPNKLKCIKCDSSKGEECEADKIKAEAVTCTGNHNLNERETCFVQKVTSEDNKVTTKRGCFFELA